MKGLLWKDCLTIRKKYGLPRLVLDLAILAALPGGHRRPGGEPPAGPLGGDLHGHLPDQL